MRHLLVLTSLAQHQFPPTDALSFPFDPSNLEAPPQPPQAAAQPASAAPEHSVPPPSPAWNDPAMYSRSEVDPFYQVRWIVRSGDTCALGGDVLSRRMSRPSSPSCRRATPILHAWPRGRR